MTGRNDVFVKKQRREILHVECVIHRVTKGSFKRRQREILSAFIMDPYDELDYFPCR